MGLEREIKPLGSATVHIRNWKTEADECWATKRLSGHLNAILKIRLLETSARLTLDARGWLETRGSSIPVAITLNMVRPDNQPLPSLVMESGWSESLSRLREDMNLWLIGGQGQVKATIILNSQRITITNTVRGGVELSYISSSTIGRSVYDNVPLSLTTTIHLLPVLLESILLAQVRRQLLLEV